MDETVTVRENSSVVLSNNPTQNSNSNISDQNSQPEAEFTSTSSENNESVKIPTNHSTSYDDMTNTMSRLSMHTRPVMNRSNSNRLRPHSSYSYHNQTPPSLYLHSNMNPTETQAELSAFTPPLMSISLPYSEPHIHQQNYHPPRSYMQNQSKEQSFKNKSQPEYYVDSFAPNFSNKPSSHSNPKPKTKHVTFQESDSTHELSNNNTNNVTFSPTSSNSSDYSSPTWGPPVPMYPHHFNPYSYPYNGFYPYHPNMMVNQRYIGRPRGMNMMPTRSVWPPRLYHPNQQTSYVPQPIQPKQLYDPNKPKTSSVSESQNPSKVIRSITPKNKKKAKQITASTSEAIPHPITILRKPSTDTEITTISPSIEDQPIFSSVEDSAIPSPTKDRPDVPPEEKPIVTPSVDDHSVSQLSLPSHKLLSILQSANCISALNEYAQQKKFTLNYEFSSIPPSSFTCRLSIDGRQFSVSSPCLSKTEAQKLACDQALRILYRESCPNEQSISEFSNKHDYIAHRSLSKFQDLNVNELLLGRKTLACMLMVTDGQFEQACVISIGTGNGCLDETNLTYADDGTALHDCHAEILARRGFIRFLFEQIKQSNDHKSSIFEYNSTINKYQLHENITFHMYISSLPCGNASLNISSNSIRYKQGQIEGTVLATTSSIKYPIKSCSDKICRWNILGIQGGLLISLITKPIYLETITLACETTFDRNHVKYSLCQRLNEHFHSLPSPFLFHLPDIDCPQTKSFQQERQVAKLQTNAFAWNITQSDRTELLEPMTGKLKNDRSISLLSKQNLFQDFTKFSNDTSLSYTTYQQAKQLDKTYVTVKNLIATAFQTGSSDTNISWLSKSDQLEQFSIQ